MTLNCIIIDDEFPARMLLSEYASKTPGLELKGTFQDPIEALDFLHKNEVDVIFLDIQMPQLTGIQFLKSLTQKPKIIFTTAYPDYALEGYELRVLDYLLKPIAFERFVESVSKASELIKLEKSKPNNAPSEKYITVRADHKIHRLLLDDILYIEGLKEYVKFHTCNEKLITLQSLKNLEDQLPSQMFLRVHKSFIINKTYVKSLYGNQLEIGAALVPIGKSYKEDILEKLF